VSDSTISDRPTSRRLPGPDVVRAVALIGVVVMNYHGYLIGRGAQPGGGWPSDLFDPFRGPLSTRFAATFVLVAGVGVALMTRTTSTPAAVDAVRWRLVRRGTLLYVVGIVLDQLWPGTILPYYGVLFVLSAALFTLRSRWILAIGVGAVVAAWALQAWRFRRLEDGASIDVITAGNSGVWRRFVVPVLIDGTHPILPWLCFFCVGIVLGRVVAGEATPWVIGWRPAVIGAGLVLFALAQLVNQVATTPFLAEMLSLDSTERGLPYVASALGTALVAYAGIDWIAERWRRPTDPLRRAGQLTLTLYLGHVVAFYAAVEWFEVVRPAGVGTALAFAVAYWVVAIAAAVWWSRRFGMGPAERLYRDFGG